MKKVNIYRVFSHFASKQKFNWLPDKPYLDLMFRARMGYRLNFDYPVSFNEKMQWLKLYNRHDYFTSLVDKYEVRGFIKETIGEQYLIPLVGYWDDVDKINFDALPKQFVLKCNHNSGTGMCICRDKNTLEIGKVKEDLKKGLAENYYLIHREWPYKNVKRKVICEKYMVDESGYELKDYKFFVFNGEPCYIQVDYDRFTDHHRNFYDLDWKYQPFTTLYPTNPNKKIVKPVNLDEMINIARKIASKIKDTPFVRIDLYNVNGRVFFGEITFFHGSGYEKFYPSEFDIKLGKMITIK